jgi:hypothetical protein
MDVKRFLSFGILGLFLISMMGVVLGDDVSAGAGRAGETLVTAIGGFFEPLLSPLFGDTELLSRVFFAILLGMIIYSVIGSIFKDSKNWIKWGITAMVTSLSLLGLPGGFLEAVRTQYGAMGATILTVIPFMIILFFSIKAENKLIARVTWLFYAGYYLAMYTYMIAISGGWFEKESLPYMAAWIVGLFLFFGIGAVRNLLFKGELEGIVEKAEKGLERRKTHTKLSDEAKKADVEGLTEFAGSGF